MRNSRTNRTSRKVYTEDRETEIEPRIKRWIEVANMQDKSFADGKAHFTTDHTTIENSIIIVVEQDHSMMRMLNFHHEIYDLCHCVHISV